MTSIIPEAALNQHIAIVGKTGSGKSYAAKGIVERLLASHRQVCVIDPTGAWWGLRLGADGKSRGHDVVLIGGKHADIPLAARSGEAVARLVTQQRASVVIDTTGLSVGEYTRWFIDFAGTLYTTISNPLHVVIDEAHYFMPQGRVPDPDAGRMLHAGNRLMSGGRSLGIRGMLITQRPAKLHKDSLSCADTLIAMRVIAPQDRGAIKDWIDGAGDPAQGKNVLDTIAGLKRGEGWVWYPEGEHLKRVTFPKITTYDSSATPVHGAQAGPKVGEIKLDEVREALAEAVKEAEANDPKLLRAKIADLSNQLYKSAKGVQTDPKIIEKAVSAAVAARDREWERAIKERDGIIGNLKGRMGKAAELLHFNGEAQVAHFQPAPVKVVHSLQIPSKKPAASVAHFPAPTRQSSPPDESGLGKGALRRILIALAQHPDGLTYRKIGVFSGVSTKGGSFTTYLSRARGQGWIEGNDAELVRITDAGLAALGSFDPLPIGRELGEYWLHELGDGATTRILRALIDAYPDALTHDEIGERAEVSTKGGSFTTYLSRLRSRELIVGSKSITASEDLF